MGNSIPGGKSQERDNGRKKSARMQGQGEREKAYHNGHVDIVTVPAALLGALEDSARVEVVVALGADTEAGDVDEWVGVGRSMGGMSARRGPGRRGERRIGRGGRL